MQHLGIPLEDLSRRRLSQQSQASVVSEADGILGVFSQSDTSVLSDWLPPGEPNAGVRAQPSSINTPSRATTPIQSGFNTPVGFDSPQPPPRVRQFRASEEGSALDYGIYTTPSERSSLVSELGPRPVGRSCFLFDSNSALRRNVFWIVQNRWYHLLRVSGSLLQGIALSYQTIRGKISLEGAQFFVQWENSLLLILYVLWTFHVIASIIAFGGFTNQTIIWVEVKATLRRKLQLTRDAVLDSAESLDQVSIHDDMGEVQQVLEKDRQDQIEDESPGGAPFFRKSWNRLEFISVAFWWIAMPPCATLEQVPLIWQMLLGMSNIRLFWLLSLWSATQVIYHSLKIALPLLSDVMIFLALSLVAFSIAGLQSFSASLSRTCVWVDPTGQQDNYTSSQICGSYIDPVTLALMPYIDRNGISSPTVKGFTCPLNSYCIEGESLGGGTLNFDNIFNAFEIVFIIMSNNTYSDIMYDVISSEQAASCLFFVCGVFVLNYWMLSLLVSVLSSSFDIAWDARPHKPDRTGFVKKIKNFFTGDNFVQTLKTSKAGRRYLAVYPLFSVAIVLDVCFQAIYSPDDQSLSANRFLYTWQIALSSVLLVEVIVRFLLYSPNWMGFFRCSMNNLDLALGIINVLTIWTFYSNTTLYAWFTFFQLVRFYRFVALFPAAERMFRMVFRNYEQLWKLTSFYFLTTLLASLVTCRMYMGQIPSADDEGNDANVYFFNLSNSFLGMYQISSTENWTDVMYYVIEASGSVLAQAFTGALFSMWLVFSNFIVVNLFISVMTGGFSTSLTNKRQEQVRRFVARNIKGESGGPITRAPPVVSSVIERLRNGIAGKPPNDSNEEANPLDHIGKVAEKELLAEFLKVSETENTNEDGENGLEESSVPTIYSYFENNKFIKWLLSVYKRCTDVLDRDQSYKRHVKRGEKWRKRTDMINRQKKRLIHHGHSRSDATDNTDVSSTRGEATPVPKPTPPAADNSQDQTLHNLDDIELSPRRAPKGSSSGATGKSVRIDITPVGSEDSDGPNSSSDNSGTGFPLTRADETREYLDGLFSAHKRHETQTFERSKESPIYEKSLYLFSSDSQLRRFCQKLTPCSHGKRISGVEPNPWIWSLIWLISYVTSVAVVVVSSINTPIYHIQHTKDLQRDSSSWTWITYLDLIFTCLFFVEFMIKVIADGFHFSPNAYTYSPWNMVDLLVLLSMIVTVINNFVAGPVSRYSRAIMAFRALRLISVNTNSEEVFTAVFFSGIGRILINAVVGLAVVFPYSVWGLNLFHNQLKSCNDGTIDDLSQCYNEYMATPFNWEIAAPRYATDPYFNYNSFGEAMLIQFGVLSLEGWIDVLFAVTSITGYGTSASQPFNRMINGLYPILYNFIGTVLIMTMFLSTIIRNYSVSRLTAYLTSEQLTWHYMKRTLRELRPKMQLPSYPVGTLRQVLLKSIANPKSVYSIGEMALILTLTVLYVIYHYPMSDGATEAYHIVVAVVSLLYVSLIVIKAVILGWRVFCSDRWNVFGAVVTVTLAAFTVTMIGYQGDVTVGLQRASALLSIALWIPKIPPVRRLFRAATINATELSTITNTYFILFLTFAIAFNQTFGITKLGSTGNAFQNFRSVPNALILLFKMSTGEGWNEILVDYKLNIPYCTAGSFFFESDCGSKAAATILFIAWNIISMYIFANLFISVIYDTFWYLYRRTTISVSSKDLQQYQWNWQRYDPHSKGSILSSQLYQFLGSSRGYFSIGIYSDDPDYNLRTIVERSKCRRSQLDPYNVDYEAINRYLAKMPVEKFQQKRRLFNLFCQHAVQDVDTGKTKKKIQFQKLLLQFPLYKDMDPSKVMDLTEFIELKVKLYQIKLVLATNFVRRRWRLRQSSERKIPDLNVDGFQFI